MNNYYLKYNSKSGMKTSFRSHGWIHTVEYDGETTEFYAWFDSDQNNIGTIDVIGDMWTEPVLSDNFNEDGTRDVITESQQIPGYHVNITTDLDLPSNLNKYLVYPETPKRLTNFATKLEYIDYDLEVASLEEL